MIDKDIFNSIDVIYFNNLSCLNPLFSSLYTTLAYHIYLRELTLIKLFFPENTVDLLINSLEHLHNLTKFNFSGIILLLTKIENYLNGYSIFPICNAFKSIKYLIHFIHENNTNYVLVPNAIEEYGSLSNFKYLENLQELNLTYSLHNLDSMNSFLKSDFISYNLKYLNLSSKLYTIVKTVTFQKPLAHC